MVEKNVWPIRVCNGEGIRRVYLIIWYAQLCAELIHNGYYIEWIIIYRSVDALFVLT